MGPPAFGQFIPEGGKRLAYYFEVTNIYGDTTFIASANSPIVVEAGKIESGKDLYVSGTWPAVPPPKITFLSPSQISDLRTDGRVPDIPVTINCTASTKEIHFEGIVETKRECESVYVDSVLAELLPPSPDQIQKLRTTSRLIKFSCDFPVTGRDKEIPIVVRDVGGAAAWARFKLVFPDKGEAPVTQTQKSLPVRIAMIDPLLRDDNNDVAVTGGERKISLRGAVSGGGGIRSVSINGYDTKLKDVDATFEYSAFLKEGVNKFTIVAVGNSGEKKQRTVSITSLKSPSTDTLVAPVIEITYPHQNQSFNTSRIVVSARVSNRVQNVSLTINGIEKKHVGIEREGDASVLLQDTVQLVQGKNNIVISASNETRSSSKAIEVQFKPPFEQPSIFLIAPSSEIVAESSIALDFNVSNYDPELKISVCLNNEVVQSNLEPKTASSDTKKPVEFLCPLRIRPGVNKILISAIGTGRNVQLEKKVFYGLPTITFIAPKETVTTEGSVEVRILVSNVRDERDVTILKNGKIVDGNRGIKPLVEREHSFEISRVMALDQGANSIVVTARNGVSTRTEAISLLYQLSIPFDHYHALLIGVQDYPEIPGGDLDKPIRDARNLRDVLTSAYTFDKKDVVMLENPSRSDILQAFANLSSTLTEKDNLVVFYAGHGVWDPVIEQGYWLPSDASRRNHAEWISNSDIRDNIKAINAKHVLLITDACFGGSIFQKSRTISLDPAAATKLYEKLSRKAVTSGFLTEAPDESIFLLYLLKELRENKDKLLDAESLVYRFKPAVVANSKTVPQYGTIQDCKDEGGTFIFVRK